MHGAELLLELGGVILGLGILGRVAGRLGLSPIPLYLLAGLAFGKGGLLPLVTATEFIQTGAELGVILLLLLLGIEYSAEELTASLRRSAGAGLVDLALNFTPGLAAGMVLTKVVPVVVALVTVAVVLAVTLRWGRTISRLVFTPNDEVLLLVVLGLALLVAGLAQRLQVSAAVGAFLVGIAVSGPAAASAGPLLAPLRDLFAAVFFVFFGLQTDPAQIPGVALPALALAVVTVLTKLATGWWAGRRAGIGPAGRVRAGTVLVARGEFSIVIAGLAVAAGVQARLGPLATAYVLTLAVLGPLLARAADPLAATLARPARPPLEHRTSPPTTAGHPDADPSGTATTSR